MICKNLRCPDPRLLKEVGDLNTDSINDRDIWIVAKGGETPPLRVHMFIKHNFLWLC
ncbi:hypothetical protein NIES2100_39390 [Calothrix sp. NIES-2100]|nr:hypothetical protein NIES2100_39390 [Calothrix sp. NIES-2100]